MQLDDLQRVAEQATPGPWHPLVYGQQADVRATREGGSTWIAECRAKEDATYIAAIDPRSLLKLIAVARAAQEYEGTCPADPDTTKAFLAASNALRAALAELSSITRQQEQ
jgi:uncharacterized protein YciI